MFVVDFGTRFLDNGVSPSGSGRRRGQRSQQFDNVLAYDARHQDLLGNL